MRYLLLLLLLAAPAFAAPARIVDQPFRQASRTGQYVVHGRYPQVPGAPASVNRLLRQAFFTNPDALEAPDRDLYRENPYEEEVTYEVTYNRDDLLSVQVTSLGMMQRAAHPSFDQRGVTVNVKTGRQILWSDLFADSAAVDPLIVKALRRDKDLPPDMAPDPAVKREFVFTKEGIRLLDLFTGAARGVTPTIPWDEARPLLKERFQ